jgi:hypothetical protein
MVGNTEIEAATTFPIVRHTTQNLAQTWFQSSERNRLLTIVPTPQQHGRESLSPLVAYWAGERSDSLAMGVE